VFIDPSSQPRIVINEFATRAGSDACGEFVELRNDGLIPATVGGWQILASTPSGTTAVFATIAAGMALNPGCHLLVATPTAPVVRDAAGSCSLDDSGGLALSRPDGLIADQVGMSSGSKYGEGTRLQSFSAAPVLSSYARVSDDTDNNVRDFVFGVATPQSVDASCAIR
jgi:hypothetical protein